MSLLLTGCVVVFFSCLAFWKYNTLLFMVAYGTSLMLGLQWYDVYTTNSGLSVSLMLISYSLVCAGFAFTCIFKRTTEEVE